MHTASIARRAAWLVPMVGLLACAKKEGEANPATAQPAAQAPAPPPPAPVSTALTAENNSGMSGNITLTRRGDSTAIDLTLNGGRAGTTYASHLHAGTCDNPGAMLIPLTSVKMGPGKTGSSTTMVLASALDSARAKTGTLLAQSHLANGKPAVCGQIPAVE